MRTLWDTFTRPDTAGGVVGNAESGQPWSLTGGGIASTHIASGRLVLDAGNTAFYLYNDDIGGTLLKSACQFSLVGVGANAAITLITSPYDVSSVDTWRDVIHCYAYRDGWAVQIYDPGAVATNIKSGTFEAPLANDGTVYSYSIERDANDPRTLIVNLPAKDSILHSSRLVITDDRFINRWGKHVIYEVVQFDGVDKARFESVEAYVTRAGTLQIPPEGSYSDIERDLIDNEPPGLFPEGQDSVWGQVRKAYGDYLTFNFSDKLAEWYNNLDPGAVLPGDFPEWEYMLGMPDLTGFTDSARRSFYKSRREQGPFTRLRRNRVIEAFISATFGTPLSFGSAGLVLDAGGLPLFAGSLPLPSTYRVYEDIRNFAYEVRIDSAITPDIAGLTRELKRITPAGIVLTVNNSLAGAAILDYQKDVLNDQPVLKLALDGNAVDSSGYGNNGTLVGGATGGASLIPNVPGATAAVAFDGAGDYITVPSAAQYQLGRYFTTEFWIRPTALPAAGQFAYLWILPGSHTLYVDEAGNLYLLGGVSGYATIPSALAAGVTAHVVVRVDGDVVEVIINNVPKIVTLTSPVYGTQAGAAYLGGFSTAGTDFNGRMDGFALYNRPLPDDRVSSHYKTGQNIT